jgi:uncharacterized membrane protein
MATNRGFDRLVNFSDAVVAIAITILVLPLVDEASNIGHGDVNLFLMGVVPQLMVFILSFAVIANYWFHHHNLFDQLKQVDLKLMLLNTLWLFGIVFIPFPPALIVDSRGPSGWASMIYMGAMLFISVMQMWMNLYVLKHRGLMSNEEQPLAGVIASKVISFLLVVAIVIALLFPDIGLWALLLLWTTPLLVILLKKRTHTS